MTGDKDKKAFQLSVLDFPVIWSRLSTIFWSFLHFFERMGRERERERESRKCTYMLARKSVLIRVAASRIPCGIGSRFWGSVSAIVRLKSIASLYLHHQSRKHTHTN